MVHWIMRYKVTRFLIIIAVVVIPGGALIAGAHLLKAKLKGARNGSKKNTRRK